MFGASEDPVASSSSFLFFFRTVRAIIPPGPGIDDDALAEPFLRRGVRARIDDGAASVSQQGDLEGRARVEVLSDEEIAMVERGREHAHDELVTRWWAGGGHRDYRQRVIHLAGFPGRARYGYGLGHYPTFSSSYPSPLLLLGAGVSDLGDGESMKACNVFMGGCGGERWGEEDESRIGTEGELS